MLPQANRHSADLIHRAARALAAINGATAVDTLLRLLKDEDLYVRRTAVVALGELKAEKAGDALAALLQDDSPGLRKAAAVALGKIGYKSAWTAIAAAVSSSRNVPCSKQATPAASPLRMPRTLWACAVT